MPRLTKKQKRKLKHQAVKILTICLVVVTVLITARTTYVISPLPFDHFSDWRQSQMQTVFAVFTVLLLGNIFLPVWALRMEKFKAAAVLSVLLCTIPLIWLITIFTTSVNL